MTTTTAPTEPANRTFAVWYDANRDPYLTYYRVDAHSNGYDRWFNADQHDTGDDDEPKTWAELCELGEGMDGPHTLVPVADMDRLRARVADLADKLHKAQQDNASHTKAATTWANETAAKDKVIEAAEAWREFPTDEGSTGQALRAAVDALPKKAEVAR